MSCYKVILAQACQLYPILTFCTSKIFVPQGYEFCTPSDYLMLFHKKLIIYSEKSTFSSEIL